MRESENLSKNEIIGELNSRINCVIVHVLSMIISFFKGLIFFKYVITNVQLTNARVATLNSTKIYMIHVSHLRQRINEIT